jgi:hypothetical protein
MKLLAGFSLQADKRGWQVIVEVLVKNSLLGIEKTNCQDLVGGGGE